MGQGLERGALSAFFWGAVPPRPALRASPSGSLGLRRANSPPSRRRFRPSASRLLWLGRCARPSAQIREGDSPSRFAIHPASFSPPSVRLRSPPGGFRRTTRSGFFRGHRRNAFLESSSRSARLLCLQERPGPPRTSLNRRGAPAQTSRPPRRRLRLLGLITGASGQLPGWRRKGWAVGHLRRTRRGGQRPPARRAIHGSLRKGQGEP